MEDEVIAEFDFSYDSFTGATEHVNLTDIDRAVAGFFQHVVNTLTVTDIERDENQEFARFCDRPKNRKLYAGKFKDPEHFVRTLASKLGKDIHSDRKELLPACYISRDNSLTFADGNDYKDATDVARLSNSSGPYAQLNHSFLKLSYTVTGVAWTEPTLTRLMLGLMMWLRHTKAGRPHTFNAKTMIANAPIECLVSVGSKKDAIGEGVEIPVDTSRIVAMSVMFEITAEVYEAEEIMRVKAKSQLMGGGQIE